MLFKRIKFNTSVTGSFKIVFNRLKQGNYLFKSINSLRKNLLGYQQSMGVFTFSFPPQNHNPSNKDLSSLLSYIKTILTKDFITQGFQSQHHNSFKKNKGKKWRGGERIKYQNQIRDKIHL